jgi:hypothetical protein
VHLVRIIWSATHTVFCAVEDNEPGIDPKNIPRLFEDGGIAPICRSLIESHGGRISQPLWRLRGLALFAREQRMSQAERVTINDTESTEPHFVLRHDRSPLWVKMRNTQPE